MKKLFFIFSIFLSLGLGAQDLVSDIDVNGKYGFRNSEGTFVIAPQYDNVHFGFYNGVACVVKNNGYYLIDEHGNVLSSKYSWVGMFDEKGLCKVAKGTRPDDDGNPMGGTYGFVNLSGSEVVPVKYARLDDFGESDIALVNKGGGLDKKTGSFTGGKYGFIGRDGLIVLKPKYAKIGNFGASGKAWTNVGGKVDDMGKCVGGKYGFVDASGREIVKPKYESVGDFHEGIAAVKKKFYGYIDETGKEITGLVYDIAEAPVNGVAKVGTTSRWSGSKYGFIDLTGKALTDIVYNEAGDFTEGFTYVKKGKKFGFLDIKGQPITEMIYDGCSSLSHGLAVCSKDGKVGCVNVTGAETVPFIYSALQPLSDNAIAAQIGTSDSGDGVLYRVIDFKGEPLTPNYTWIGISPDSPIISVIQQGVGAGAINYKGEIIIPLIYNTLYPFAEGAAPVQIGDKWGFINTRGDVFVECKYDAVSARFLGGVGGVSLDGKWGGVISNGSLAIPISLNTIEELFEVANTSYVKFGYRPLNERDIKAFYIRKEARGLRFNINKTIEDSYWDY